MNDEVQQTIPDRSAARAQFSAKLQRYTNLLRTRWWLLLVGIPIGAVAPLVLWQFATPGFVSLGRMIVNVKLAIPEGSVYTEEWANFPGTQAALMQSGIVVERAHARVAAFNPDLSRQKVSLKVSVLPKTTIFILQATSTDAQYSQAFLQSAMEEYVNLKKEMRARTSDTTFAGLTEEVLRLEKELRKSDQDLVQFQSTNSLVLLQDQGNTAGNYLALLNNRLAAQKSEYQLLQNLTLDQNLDRLQQLNGSLASSNDSADKPISPMADRLDADYLKARQQILLLKAEQSDWAQSLRPKHPKMLAFGEEVARRERLLDIFRQQSADQLDSRKASLALQIQNLEKDVREWEAKTLELNRKTAEYQRLKASGARIQALYDRLLATMQTLDVNREISPESVTIMEKASTALPDRTAVSKQSLIGSLVGVALTLLLLLFLDRLDDKVNSLADLQELLDEPVLAQIPKEKTQRLKGELALLQPDETRHAFIEAYRNLRSSLLCFGHAAERPRIILVTSSEPDEGKSLTSANLALALAQSGSRVLLIDADMRKGVLHGSFGLPAEPGLSEALAHSLNWSEAVQPTKTPNLSLLPHGGFTQRASELFISAPAAKILTEGAANYDFVILDTAPVMAADDVTSLAPHADGVLFVIRSERTSGRVARAALELLYRRRIRVLGLVLNAVRPGSAGYYNYHKYKDYYPTPGEKPWRE
jgi:capsular exopolysaccharide synthesis family protein